MRAGKLDRTISIETLTQTVDEYGGVVDAWAPMATLRAQIIEASTDEFQRAYGAGGETAIVFRTRYLDGVTLDARVMYGGEAHNIISIKEIGRRRGLELRVRRLGD